MSQSTTPYALRLGINADWRVNYLFSKEFDESFVVPQVYKIMRMFSLDNDDKVSSVRIDINDEKFLIFISTSNINYFTDDNNKRLNDISAKIKLFLSGKFDFTINLNEDKNPLVSAKYISKLIASKIETRVKCKTAIRTVLASVYSSKELKGVTVKISGRLNGKDKAKTMKFPQNERMPLSKFSEIIESDFSEAKTSYGIVGVTVTIYKYKGYRKNFSKFPDNTKKRNDRRRPFSKIGFKKNNVDNTTKKN